MDISNICRSCMKELTSCENENFNRKAVQMFCFCTNINITDEDKLPKHFCNNCIFKIESSYMYIIEAHKVDATLKNIVSRNTSVIVELETCSTDTIIKHTDNLRLTLPDYKICSAVDNYEQILNDSTDVSNENDDKETVDSTVDTKNIHIQFSRKDNKPESVKETENLNTKKNFCPVCRKGFTSKVWFNKHMEKEHTGSKYACTHCPKTFSKASQLAYHATSHSDERRFACNACGKRFKRRKQLTIHARAHEDIRPYACDKCSMRFKLKSVLKCHMKVHEGDKQYLCYFCGWSFAQAGNLKVHLRVHTGEKPFSCAQCGFRAAAACSLQRHLRRHAAARTHCCSHCTKGFYDASGLARHVRTHTGERPYQCPACARAFRDSWTRKTHLMRAHRHTLADIPRMRRDGRLVNTSTHSQA